MSEQTLHVARSVAEHDTANAVDRATVIVDRVEVYFHNDTYAAAPEGTYPDKWRPLFPYDTDEVSLVAIIWARAEGEDEFKPYCGEGFRNDGHYYAPCEKRPSPKFNGVPHDWREALLDDRLPDEVEEVQAWPWTGIDMQFEWQQLDFHGEGGNGGRDYTYDPPKLVRMTTFPKGSENSDDAIASEKFIHDWDIPLSGEFGTRRFRVVVGLSEEVQLSKKHARIADQEHTLKLCNDFAQKITSRRREGSRGYAERGFALRLSVRKDIVPQARNDYMTETLRWGTAFVNTAYDNGGHWFGGREAVQANQRGGGVYGGHGIDCNGFICGAAMLAGMPGYAAIPFEEYLEQHKDSKKSEEELEQEWSKARRRYRYAPMFRKRRYYKGAPVTNEDLRPGDMLDFLHESHVALVWQVDADGSIWILDSSGSRQGVSIHKTGKKLRNIHKMCQLVDLTDPQPRPWEE